MVWSGYFVGLFYGLWFLFEWAGYNLLSFTANVLLLLVAILFFGLNLLHYSIVFNQKTLYNAYKKRSKNVKIDIEEYNRMKEVDPEFYREASTLQYGKVTKQLLPKQSTKERIMRFTKPDF